MAELLKAEPGPATALLEGLAQVSLHIEAAPGDVGPHKLTQKEWGRLSADPFETAWHRIGRLVTPAGATVAQTTVIWLPFRLPEDARVRLLHSDEPFGTILGPLGMTRIDRLALAYEEDDGCVVVSSAVLALPGGIIGMASERIMRELCLLATGRSDPRGKGAVCKTVVSDTAGSIPASATRPSPHQAPPPHSQGRRSARRSTAAG